MHCAHCACVWNSGFVLSKDMMMMLLRTSVYMCLVLSSA